MIKKLKVALKKLASDESGFTLLEMIISIGILSMTSGFILQMFLVSATVNKRALDADMGLNTAIGAIEAIKGLSKFDDIKALTDYEVSVEGNKVKVYEVFDSDWTPIKEGASDKEGVSGLDIRDYPPEAMFVLEVDVKNTPNVGIDSFITFSTAGDFIESFGTGQLCEMECQVYELKRDGEIAPSRVELARFASRKYFSY
ncbi:MAG: type II secretion system GspH family protein [Clostridiales bacterium]|nr:type II secretion system GspH family protein [Clostridiales bacterium]MDR2752044.1 type II secretion system GspH family protein [Clostridiales bacterium]